MTIFYMGIVNNFLVEISDLLDYSAKKFRGAARRLTPEISITQSDCERQNWQNVGSCFVNR